MALPSKAVRHHGRAKAWLARAVGDAQRLRPDEQHRPASPVRGRVRRRAGEAPERRCRRRQWPPSVDDHACRRSRCSRRRRRRRRRCAGCRRSLRPSPTCSITPAFITATRSRHGQRLALIVRDVDEGDADPLLDRAQLVAHVLAQPEVERRERLVEQQHLGLDRQRACDRDALLLAAGQLGNPLVALVRQARPVAAARPPCRSRSARADAAHAQAVADILGHRHQREQREVLEDQRGRALVGADAGHVRAADADRRRRTDRGSRRWCAAAWSCRSRTGRGSRRTRRH